MVSLPHMDMSYHRVQSGYDTAMMAVTHAYAENH